MTGNGLSGAIVSVWSCVVGTTLTAGVDTLEVTFDIALTSKVIRSAIFSKGAGNTVSLAASAHDSMSAGTDPPSISVSGLSSHEYLFIRGDAVETAQVNWTLDGNYIDFDGNSDGDATTVGGSDDQNIGAHGSYRILTGTGDSNNPAGESNKMNAGILAAFLEAASNAPPVLGAIGNKTVREQTLLAFTATATDADLNGLTFSLQGSPPSGAAITSGGNFTWTPTHAQVAGSPHSITIRVSDGTDFDEETIQVTVSPASPAQRGLIPSNRSCLQPPPC